MKRGANNRCAYGAPLAIFMVFAGPMGTLVLGLLAGDVTGREDWRCLEARSHYNEIAVTDN